MEGLRRFGSSLYTAFTGIVFVVRLERNARFHLVIATLALLLGLVLHVTDAQLAAIFFACILVFVTEVINTAIEKTLDLIDVKSNAQVRIIKDMAAGAVLVTALGAAAIGVVIFVPYILGALWPR